MPSIHCGRGYDRPFGGSKDCAAAAGRCAAAVWAWRGQRFFNFKFSFVWLSMVVSNLWCAQLFSVSKSWSRWVCPFVLTFLFRSSTHVGWLVCVCAIQSKESLSEVNPNFEHSHDVRLIKRKCTDCPPQSEAFIFICWPPSPQTAGCRRGPPAAGTCACRALCGAACSPLG